MVKLLVMEGKSTTGMKISELSRETTNLSNIELSLYNVNIDASRFELSCNIELINNEYVYAYQMCLLNVNPNTLTHSDINILFKDANVLSDENIQPGVITNKQVLFSNNIDDLHAISTNSTFTPIEPSQVYYISLRMFYNNKYISNMQEIYIADSE